MKTLSKASHHLLATVLIIVALLWNLLWWFIIAPETPTLTGRHQAKQLRNIPVPKEHARLAPGRDPALIWSPVLFAYPSAAGFSKSVLNQGGESLPPLFTRRDLSAMMKRPAASKHKLLVQSEDVKMLSHNRLQTDARVPRPEAPLFTPQAVEAFNWQFRLTQNGAPAAFKKMVVPKLNGLEPGTSPAIEFELETGEWGAINQVFLLNPGRFPQLERRLLRSLFAARLNKDVVADSRLRACFPAPTEDLPVPAVKKEGSS